MSRNRGCGGVDQLAVDDDRGAVPLRIAPLIVVGLILVVLAVIAVATL